MRSTHTNLTRITLCLVALLLAGASIAAAAPPREAPAPIATEHLGGTTLSVTPQIAYESAILRIAGPDGYALTKRFPAGEPITADLLAEAKPRDELLRVEAEEATASLVAPTTLPDGRYRYEVVFRAAAGERRFHTGIFYGEDGGLRSRESKQAELALLRSELATFSENVSADGEVGALSYVVDDFLHINDAANDGSTTLILNNDCSGAFCANTWHVEHSAGDFEISSKKGVFSDPYVPRLTILDSNGSVGIGTTAPVEELHVLGELRLESSFFTADISLFDDGVCIAGPDIDGNAFCVHENSPHGALEVTHEGIGVGTFSPIAPLHVIGDTFNSANTMQIERRDGITPNIRFRTSGGGVTQNWLFQNNGTSGVFAIRDETGGNSVLRLRPGAPENGLTINANGSFTTSTGAILTAGGVWQNASSRALKEEITALPLEQALAALTDLRAVTFAYKKTPGEAHVGFIAEEVPDLVATASRKTLSTMEIVGVLTRVVQEQQRINAQLRLANATLAESVAALEAQIAD